MVCVYNKLSNLVHCGEFVHFTVNFPVTKLPRSGTSEVSVRDEVCKFMTQAVIMCCLARVAAHSGGQ
jgi:hypothetical protein